MSARTYVVDLLEEAGGPEPSLRDRFVVVIERRFEQLEEQRGVYPKAGDAFDFMDAFAGKFVWEMTDAEFEATPPSLVDFEVLEVDPVEPVDGGIVHVRVRIPT